MLVVRAPLIAGSGTRDIVDNFISGRIRPAERPIRTADFIEIDNTNGIVVASCTWFRRSPLAVRLPQPGNGKTRLRAAGQMAVTR